MTRLDNIDDLECVLTDVYIFFRDTSGIKLRSPAVEISDKVKDTAWYGNSTISINPAYNHENLNASELIAHEFFHYVQDQLFWKKLIAKPSKESSSKISEFMEGTAFLFASLFLKLNKKVDVIAYMNDRNHMTKSGVGNKIALKAYELSKENTKEFIKNTVDRDFIIKLLDLGQI